MKKLSNETESKIKENNNTISMLLNRNENLYLSELTDLERRLSSVNDGINIPNEYIRKKDEFIELYSLNKITNNYQHQSNIAYLMQYGDLIHYFFTRFSIFGQIKSVHYYHEIINIASILEIILKELAQNYRDICFKCSYNKKCNKLITKTDMHDLKVLLKRLCELNIINLSQKPIQTLNDLIDLRNKIHLRLMDSTIYNNPKYTTSNYNNYMLTFKALISSISFDNIKCSNI